MLVGMFVIGCQLLELLFDNLTCKGIIVFKVNIYSLRMLLLHLHALQLRLCTSILDSELVLNRCRSRIWSNGAKLPWPKVADAAEQSRMSKVSYLLLGSRACSMALEAFGFLMLKYAVSYILKTLFLSFLTSTLTAEILKFSYLRYDMLSEARLKCF